MATFRSCPKAAWRSLGLRWPEEFPDGAGTYGRGSPTPETQVHGMEVNPADA
jgi:hypothetical protein